MFEIGTASDYLDLLEKLDTFLTTNGSAFGLTYAGTGNGTLTAYRGGASSVAETFTITATNATNFTVVGSVSGSIGPATAGTPFSHAKIAFTITAGGTAFIAGDVFTLTTAPKWTNMRKARGATTTASSGTTGQSACENVIDGKEASDTNRSWIAGTLPQQLEVTFITAETIVEYGILASSSDGPRTWTFEYWNGSSWVTLDTRTTVTFPATAGFNSYTIASPVSATRYRINISAGYTTTPRIHAMELRRAAADFNAAFGQYIWKAPGNDGTSEIYVGVHHFRRADADYFDWELAAFDGFTSALVEFYAQSNFQGDVYLPLLNGSMPYWFVCNGRRVIVVAKVGSQYEVAYLGLIDPYFTPAQVPYPMALGGTLAITSKPFWDSVSWRWSNSTNQHRAFTHSDPNTTATNQALRSFQMRARRPDGVYAGFAATYSDNYNHANLATEDFIWPYGGDFSLLDVNLDGSYALFPVQLHHRAPNSLGQLDQVRAVTGQGMTAESTVKVGQVNYLVVQNINRTDRNDWLAVGLD